MIDLTGVVEPPPTPLTGRVVHHKTDAIEFSSEQITRLFWLKINRAAANGCWEWTGARFFNGYGKLTIARRTLYSHRVSYEIHKGVIPAGLHIDHLCRNRSCCNPAHLDAVTCRENVLRSPIALAAVNALKTHCNRGHEFTPENTIVTKGGRGRTCRICRRWHEARTAARQAGRPLPEQPQDTPVHRRSGTHCPNGHPYDAENTYVQADGGRRCRACARAARQRFAARGATAAGVIA